MGGGEQGTLHAPRLLVVQRGQHIAQLVQYGQHRAQLDSPMSCSNRLAALAARAGIRGPRV